MSMEQKISEQVADGELIRAYLSGDAESFEILYSRYRKPLYAFLNRLLENSIVADDLFQQTWLKAIRNFPAYENKQKFFAWLSTIAHNLVMDYFRSQKRAAEQPLDEGVLNDRCTDGSEAWSQMNDEEFETAFENAVNELPSEQKEVVILRRDGLSFKEIAEIQKCPLNTALGRMNYALKSLRNSLRAWRDS
ncbi:MAG: sigma-70 family RNA polymerase sigma factor [Lentisphaeria bacterium]|nr:sigma-70 family RNA polymerase sigma factor [Lentisphaeria bacterium]